MPGSLFAAINNLKKQVTELKASGLDKITTFNTLKSLGIFNKWPSLPDAVGIVYDSLDGKSHAVLEATYPIHKDMFSTVLGWLTDDEDFSTVISIQDSSEFPANTYTTDSQSSAAIAGLTTGEVVIVWHSLGQDLPATYGIYAQKYDQNHTPLGSEFLVNTYITDNQQYPSVIGLENGGFAIFWQSEGQDGDDWGVYGQIYGPAPSYSIVKSEFQINVFTTGKQQYPSAAALPGGGFVVIWQSEGQDGSGFGIYGQVYGPGPSYSIVKSEFQVNVFTTGDQIVNTPNPVGLGVLLLSPGSSVDTLDDGGFVVTWQSTGQDGDGTSIHAQVYGSGPAHNVAKSEFQVNTFTTGNQGASAVAGLYYGGFVIAWNDPSQDGSIWGVYGQRYDSNSDPLGNEFRINEETDSSQIGPSIIGLDNGWFVAAWSSFLQDGDSLGIFGRVYHPNGTTLIDEFQMNDYTTSIQYIPALANVSGGFVAAWDSLLQDGSGYGIYGKTYEIT